MPRLDRYQDQKVFEALAGDYVLGTMAGRARRRFRQLMVERGYIREAVTEWERRLNPLGQRIAPVQPHPRVWRNIKREVGAQGERRTTFWNSLPIWRTAAFASTLLLVGLIFYQLTTPVGIAPTTPSYIAVLVDEQKAPIIVATATRQPRRLMIIMVHRPQVARDSDLELWAIPEAGGAPVSMGVLSKDRKALMALDARRLRMMPKTGVLAISREPKGGSPTGGPTGPVVYQGQLVTL